MKLLFLTLGNMEDVSRRDIYTDLMRAFRDAGHEVYIVSPRERRLGLETSLEIRDGVHVLAVRTLNIQKTGRIGKGIGTVLIERQYRDAIRAWLSDVRFNLILYSTPPITLTGVIRDLKRRNPEAVTYLLLKDIFPQNAVDLGMFGRRSMIYRFFRRKERGLYRCSDHIGCMSPANVAYLLRKNPWIGASRVEVAPNSVEPVTLSSSPDRKTVRERYGLPMDRTVFIYGGNLGEPQGIDYMLACLETGKDRQDLHFVIVGDGTEYGKIVVWMRTVRPANVSLFRLLPREEYDALVRACDVGLIFLDHRFTIPNYPSRLLSYLEARMPVIAATDPNTDVGSIAEANGYGYWCESVDPADFIACVDRMLASDIRAMGENGYRFFLENHTVKKTYDAIISHV